jgi:TonB family protein
MTSYGTMNLVEGREDWRALGISLLAHAVLLLLAAFVFHTAGPSSLDEAERRRHVVEVTFEPVPILADEGGAPVGVSAAPQTDQPPAQRPRPEPRRPSVGRPMAATPVRLPDAPASRAGGGVSPPPAPTDRAARPTTPAPPTPREEPDARPAQASAPVDTRNEQGGTSATGAPGTGGSSDAGGQGGTGGGAGVAYGGLGSRAYTCRTPANPGASGTVSYYITFAPSGRYVSSRPRQRSGNPQLDAAARAVLSTCRAAPLPEEADQVNQEGHATFRFTLR